MAIRFNTRPDYKGAISLTFDRADGHTLSYASNHSLVEWHGGKLMRDYGTVLDGTQLAVYILAFLTYTQQD